MIYDIIWNLNYFIKRPLNNISLVIIKEGEPSKTTNSPSYDKNVLKSNLNTPFIRNPIFHLQNITNQAF